jgi:hypothetical protein
LLLIGTSAEVALLDFGQYREKSRSENFPRSARLAIRRRRIYGGFAAVWRASPAAKRAFCSGIVKLQQGWAAEALKTGNG